MDDEERAIDNFLNSLISSCQHAEEVIKAFNGGLYVYKSDNLCMVAGDEQPLEDVFMQVNKEMKLLEEMTGVEEFLIKQVFKDNGDEQLSNTVMKMEGDVPREDEKQLNDMLIHRDKGIWKTSEETQRSHLFETNEMIMSAGIEKGRDT